MDNSDLGRVGDAEQATQQSSSPAVSALSGEYPSRELITVPRELASRVEAFLQEVVSGIEDEGDRAYFSSTNQADALRDLSREVTLAMYDIMYAEGGHD